VADTHGLTDKLLEVLPVAPEALKEHMIAFLPEVATEDNYEASRVGGVAQLGVGRGAEGWGCG